MTIIEIIILLSIISGGLIVLLNFNIKKFIKTRIRDLEDDRNYYGIRKTLLSSYGDLGKKSYGYALADLGLALTNLKMAIYELILDFWSVK